MDAQWRTDFLGTGYQCLTLELGEDDEGPIVATLVSHAPKPPPPPTVAGRARELLHRLRAPVAPEPVQAVLYIHGWTDYFFQTELADFWAGLGVAFYALDLRKYGRSLRPGQTAGYITDLQEYDADIEAAMAALTDHIRSSREADTPVRISLMAHSTGGLVASLWAHRHPGRIEALILNSPWLELRGSWIVRTATAGLLEPLARLRPKARLKVPELTNYWRSISRQGDGEWDLDPQLRPPSSWPIRAGWISAVLNGHAQVARGLDIRVPILLLASATSTVAVSWTETMKTSDSVLDVNLMVQRGLLLGPQVTVCRFDDALHDVLLSSLPVRRRVYGKLEQWARAFVLKPERSARS
ncbi:alpha/beta hydrolase [Arthrobacter gengyunqii]|uniref:Alpha/beta hydrolase n=1 Tax=Arthrobacter gengyunqii TaxID=2886940 RepID=A0A9X1M1D6_9MICC|nr:alpha/beta hydrolase [Arthrobacter gengyunqii]MCC3269191.1 alpha/beta hydrolase [Arthrobacter gengyunqii]UOY94851.1 alpha/beta hydrolase [Arthrobacter gengyunqii]